MYNGGGTGGKGIAAGFAMAAAGYNASLPILIGVLFLVATMLAARAISHTRG